MKREIKFRAKIKAESFEQKLAMLDKPQSEGEWVCGDLHICDTKIPHIHCMMNKYPIDVSTIGQYTGLKDKNGKVYYVCRWLNHSFMSFTKKQEKLYRKFREYYDSLNNKKI